MDQVLYSRIESLFISSFLLMVGASELKTMLYYSEVQRLQTPVTGENGWPQFGTQYSAPSGPKCLCLGFFGVYVFILKRLVVVRQS